MPDAWDREDSRYLADGNHAALLAKYAPVVHGRCAVRVRDRYAAEDVAQNVLLRLAGELRRGKDYGELPYRVVVGQVIGWTIKEHFTGADTTLPLPDTWQPVAPDELQAVLERADLRAAFATLPERQREVAELRYLEGLDPEQIAERLGVSRNAVDQALHNAHKGLREGWLND